MQNNRNFFFRMPIGKRCVLEKGDSGAEVYLDDSKSFSITIPESFILKKLVEELGGVVEKKVLICEAWGNPEIIGPNSLPVAITNLRKILDLADIKIINVPRVGYRLYLPELEMNHTNFAQLDDDEPEITIAEENNDAVSAIKESFSPLKFWMAVLSSAFSVYALFYIAFSWVNVDCERFGSAQVCLIEGDSFELNVLEGKKGHYYYSSQSGLMEISR